MCFVYLKVDMCFVYLKVDMCFVYLKVDMCFVYLKVDICFLYLKVDMCFVEESGYYWFLTKQPSENLCPKRPAFLPQIQTEKVQMAAYINRTTQNEHSCLG